MNKKSTIAWVVFDIIIAVFVFTFDAKDDIAHDSYTAIPTAIPTVTESPDYDGVSVEPIAIDDCVGGVVQNVGEFIETPIETETYVVTAYCPCSRCSGSYGGITSTGVRAVQGRTIAVDPNVIPYGTHVRFNGNEYVAEDCGGAIKGNHIDLYFDSHAEALEWGKKYCEIEILKGE